MANRKEQKPIEVDDDYEIDLRENIDDESETEGTGNLKFAITSYGADYPVETIVSRLNSEAFFVPPFQRNFVWSQRHASRFIESLLMGLPVPGIFLYKDAKTSRHLVWWQPRWGNRWEAMSGKGAYQRFCFISCSGAWTSGISAAACLAHGHRRTLVLRYGRYRFPQANGKPARS